MTLFSYFTIAVSCYGIAKVVLVTAKMGDSNSYTHMLSHGLITLQAHIHGMLMIRGDKIF